MNRRLSIPLAVFLSSGVACCGSEDSDGAAAYSMGIQGRVVFHGPAPKAVAVDMSADPKCQALHAVPFLHSPVVVDEDGGLVDVFVYVKEGLEGRKFPVPKKSKPMLDLRRCWFYPRVSGIMAGQKLTIMNSGPTTHVLSAEPEFKADMPEGVNKLVKRLTTPKAMLEVTCDKHPWKRAYVGVLTHPYFAVTGEDGRYKIRGLPPGTYTLEAWHETLGTVRREVTFKATIFIQDFHFSGKENG
ncbi:MAG: carboxypeptidase-like regulatory domain-containing protein [Elusimicrobiota bacterium]